MFRRYLTTDFVSLIVVGYSYSLDYLLHLGRVCGFEDLVRLIEVVKFLYRELLVLFSYPFDACRVCSDVPFYVLILVFCVFLLFLLPEVYKFYCSFQRTGFGFH